MVQNSPGMHFVRPPLLKFKKVNEDSKCKTYDVLESAPHPIRNSNAHAVWQQSSIPCLKTIC